MKFSLFIIVTYLFKCSETTKKFASRKSSSAGLFHSDQDIILESPDNSFNTESDDLDESDKKKKENDLPSEKENIPRYCNAEWCDPSHEPYPNIVSVMTGYDILKGNPFTTSQSVDPGFSTGYIFVPTYRTTDGTYALHSGVTVRQTLQCSLTSRTDTITNAQNYVRNIQSKSSQEKKFTSKLEFKVKAAATPNKIVGGKTTVSTLFDAAYTSSSDYKNNMEFFTKTQGILTLKEATCATYSVQISPFDPPPFSPGFISALEILNEASSMSSDEQRLAFEEFITEFGTHFLQQATMGARTALTRRYSNEEFRKSTENQIQKCSEDRLKMIIAGNGLGTSSNSCNNIDLSSNNYTVNGFERESITSYGSKPEKSLSEWSKQDFKSPSLIKMKLRPITDLFSPNYLRSHKNILQGNMTWFKNLYNKYCQDYNESLGIDTCEPEKKKKCGLNDNCHPQLQYCVNKNEKEPYGFDCLTRQCLTLPCKNGGSCRETHTRLTSDFQCSCTLNWQGKSCEHKFTTLTDVETSISTYLSTDGNQNLDNQNFATKLQTLLKDKYNSSYFSVISMDEHDESRDEIHAKFGKFISFNKMFKRNLVVGFTSMDEKTNSTIPDKKAIEQIKSDLTLLIANSFVSGAKRVLNIILHYMEYDKKRRKYVFIQVFDHSYLGIYSKCEEPYCIFFQCTDINKLSHFTLYDVTILFGNSKS